MRQIAILIGCSYISLILLGCQSASYHRSDRYDGTNRQTDIRHPERFPGFLVGTWKSDARSWEITFTDDGAISSFQNNNGVKVITSEGSGHLESTQQPDILCVLDSCIIDYHPPSRKLSVMIVSKQIIVGKNNEKPVEYKQTDRFAGIVSTNNTVWSAEWAFQINLENQITDKPKPPMRNQLVFSKLHADK
jgi:hypothetical protein